MSDVAVVETPPVVAEEKAVEPDETDKQLAEVGLTKADIEALKTQYGAVGLATIGGKAYVYRSVRRSELRQIRQMQVGENVDFEMLAQEKIAAKCTIAPKLTEDTLVVSGAGLANTLSELIYALSDFDVDAPPVRL